MNTNMLRTWRWLALVMAMGMLCCTTADAKKPPELPAGPEYLIIPFDVEGVQSDGGYVFGLNDAGDAVGMLEVESSPTSFHLESYHLDLDAGTYTSIPGEARSVNSSGEIAGILVGETLTLGYYLGEPGAQPVMLPPLPGDDNSFAHSINDARMIVGISRSISDGVDTAVIWRPIVTADGTLTVDGPVPLLPLVGDVSSTASDINDPIVGGAFEILGNSHDGEFAAVIWTIELNPDGTLSPPSAPRSLGTPNDIESTGHAINSLGDACGMSNGLPFLKPFDGAMQPLQVVRKTNWGWAMDINDQGQCVGEIETVRYGSSAYLWKGADSDPVELETLIDRTSGWDSLVRATRISNGGLIGGYGYYNGARTGFVMIPAR